MSPRRKKTVVRTPHPPTLSPSAVPDPETETPADADTENADTENADASTEIVGPIPNAGANDDDLAAFETSFASMPNDIAFPIVGIGASAGGLAALEAFFAGMPDDADTGMALVIVQHLAPDHKSILSDLIRRRTRMLVFEVEDGMVVNPNCTYIIPPGRDMAFFNGTLQLLSPAKPHGQRLPIDFFFRSLAQDQKEHAIGIILSGTGSDGTLGVRAIKGAGGMVMVQNPNTTEFDGMPRSAIATSLVDYVLPAGEMPAKLMAYAKHAFGKLPRSKDLSAPKAEGGIRKIFMLLRGQTGHDFSNYKPSTIHRRIERRMAMHQFDQIEAYVTFLELNPSEVEALFRDLLIGVTNFFRDPEAFQALEQRVIPQLFANRSRDAVIRVWSIGCSTGEEAYSVAILLVEYMESLKQNFSVQVFATDINIRAIETARAGLYPASIASDLTPERLARFFIAEPDGNAYRIHKGIRDLLVFSEQNVIKDPPFSRLDLLICRNMMIYMDAALQKKLIPLFNYALNPGGWLFLGSSEGIGEFGELFTMVDRKAKIYSSREDLLVKQRMAIGQVFPPLDLEAAHLPRAGIQARQLRRREPLRELTERALLAQVIAAGALVNANGDILYLHGRTGIFLELSTGEAGINNILKMAREGLSRELRITLQKAINTKDTVAHPGLRVRTNGDFTTVNLTVRPLTIGQGASSDVPLFLVVLEEVAQTQARILPAPHEAELPADPDARIAELEAALRAKEEYLQSTTEELESSGEELKSFNEEMQSVNEELQSTNEELETSKEELQSVNEELATVNSELQMKITDLTRVNNDMNNLLAGTGIGTVFVDYKLHILRFSPAASVIINLIQSDIGRPVAHIVSNLVGYTDLVRDVKSVLETLEIKETEVKTIAGLYYILRIQPYRTLDNAIEGVVISFFDITQRKQVEAKLQESEALFRAMADSAPVLIWMSGLDKGCFFFNKAWMVFTGRTLVQEQGNGWTEGVHPDDFERCMEVYVTHFEAQQRFNMEYRLRRADGEYRWLTDTGVPRFDETGAFIGFIGSCIDITEHKQL
jgi:two-component system CheB/CheR fusion protein